MKAGKRIVSGLMIAVTVLVFFGLTAASSRAAVEITPAHIHTGSAQGTLLAIDTPRNLNAPEPANIGWALVSGSAGNINSGARCWEPDGTVWNNHPQRWIPGGTTITWTFDLPDGAVIKAVYVSYTGTGLGYLQLQRSSFRFLLPEPNR